MVISKRRHIITTAIIAPIIATIKVAVSLSLDWGEIVSELVMGLGGGDSVVVDIIRGQFARARSRRKELFTQKGGPILPASDGFDRVSIRKFN